MSLSTSECQRLVAYNDWANGRLLEALDRVSESEWERDLGASFGSLQGTLAHLVVVEWVWLQRWTGTSPAAPPAWLSAPSLASMKERLGEVAEERRRWLESRTDTDLEAACSYRLTTGAGYDTPLDLLVQHAVNHSTYHRGQLVLMLRQLGHAPPSTDLVEWHHAGTA